MVFNNFFKFNIVIDITIVYFITASIILNSIYVDPLNVLVQLVLNLVILISFEFITSYGWKLFNDSVPSKKVLGFMLLSIGFLGSCFTKCMKIFNFNYNTIINRKRNHFISVVVFEIILIILAHYLPSSNFEFKGKGRKLN